MVKNGRNFALLTNYTHRCHIPQSAATCLLNETGTSSQALLRSAWQGLRLTGRAHPTPFNAHTLHGVPAAPPTDHHQQLTFSPSDRDHRPHGTTHLRRAEEGLLHQGRLDLADIR